jgi:hypothetical protein
MTVLAQRMYAQGLDGRATDVLAAVAGAGGLQAQDTAACRLQVRARTTGLTHADVSNACAEGRLVRTWLMRGTLHMVAARDVHWLVSYYGPSLVRGQRRRRLELGLTEDICVRALPALREVLTGRALSRAEIVERLAECGVRIEPKGQAPAHLLFYASASGLTCRGPELDRDEPSYVLLDEWVTDRYEPADPLAELASRYFRAYSPASAADFAHWAGIALGKAKKVAASVDDGPATSGLLRLLPAFDTYLLGYRERPVDPRYARKINAGGGWIHPAVVVDGRVVGTWRRRSGEIEVEPFEPVDEARLAAEIADITRFTS